MASNWTKEERKALIVHHDPEMSVSLQAELLSLNWSSLYYRPAEPDPETLAIRHQIDEIYTECPYYGSRRIAAVLKQKGFIVNRKAVQYHMRAMGI